MFKRVLTFLLAMAMMFSLVACGGKEEAVKEETKTEATEDKVEEKTEETTEEPAMTEEEELEAMKKEPMYEEGFKYFLGASNCTSDPYLADSLGYFEKYGIKAEFFKGSAMLEALGTNAVQLACTHVAHALVPASNGVNYVCVAGAMVGCQSLLVPTDSPIQSTSDLIGKKVGIANGGIGGPDYNIVCRMFWFDGIDPLEEIEFVVVERAAQQAALENGEIDAVLQPDSYSYDMRKDGTMRVIRSITWDDDFQTEVCCANYMNKDFIAENPLMAKYITKALLEVQAWGGENPEEAVQKLLDDQIISGSFEKNIDCWNTMHWGEVTNGFTANSLKGLIEDYIEIGLITATDDAEGLYKEFYTPLYDDGTMED